MDEVRGWHVLEQEPARAGAERVVDDVVEVERREDEDAGAEVESWPETRTGPALEDEPAMGLGLGARLAALQAQSGGFAMITPDDPPDDEVPAGSGLAVVYTMAPKLVFEYGMIAGLAFLAFILITSNPFLRELV